MRMNMRTLSAALCIVILITLIPLLPAGCGDSGPKPAGKKRIAVIPKGTSHAFWLSVKAGADKAGAELGVETIWKGPLREDDRAEQIKIVDQFVSDKIDGIVLAPLDAVALVRPANGAMQAGIPVVIFDSALRGEPGKDLVSFVATDNYKAGRLGGEELVRLLGGKGKVVLLRYTVGSASTDERERGFLDVMKENVGIEVISSNRYGGASSDSSKKEALNMSEMLKQADGIFCPNESSTLGMLEALRDLGLLGKVKFVGFDATSMEVAALQAGHIQALVAQDPEKMGYLGVKTLVAHMRGEKIDAVVDTGVRLITPESLQDPETRRFLGLK
jgi:ribose transport system substrate-binding protein